MSRERRVGDGGGGGWGGAEERSREGQVKSSENVEYAPETPLRAAGVSSMRPSFLLMPPSTPASAATSVVSTPSVSGQTAASEASAPILSLDLHKMASSAVNGVNDESDGDKTLENIASVVVQGTSRKHEPEPGEAEAQAEAEAEQQQQQRRQYGEDQAVHSRKVEREDVSRDVKLTGGGVGFLTRRLRSAIGQDILAGGDGIANAEAQAADDTGVLASQAPTDGQSEADTISKGPLTENEDSENKAQGWGWSAFTSLPSTLTLDGALRSMSLGASEASSKQDEQPERSSSSNARQAAVASTGASSYISALDVRKWFGPTHDDSPRQATGLSKSRAEQPRRRSEGSMARKKSKSPAQNLDAPTSPLKGLPAGSFPSSSTSGNKKKRAKEATPSSGAAGDQKAKESFLSDAAVEHDLTTAVLGLQSADDDQDRFPDHEFLVLSTAGKPIFASNISRARLVRAQTHRDRKRRKHAFANERRDIGAEEAANLAQADAEEEDKFAKEEQDLQGEEDQMVATRVGLVQALISNYAEAGHNLLNEKSREFLELPPTGRIRYLLKPPLYLVAIARWDEADTTLKSHLEYLYFAIISLLSVSKLNRLFDRAANFDLKRLLQGTDGILDALLSRIQRDTTAMRGTLQPLRLDAALRHDAGTALLPTRNKSQRPQDALYCLLLTRNGLVTIARARAHSIHPIDCQLLINTVFATKALKEGGTQSWVPICLPKFAPQGFVYAHVSFLDDEAIALLAAQKQSNGTATSSSAASLASRELGETAKPELGLVLVTGNPDGFDEMSAWRERIADRLQRDGLLMKLWKQIITRHGDGSAPSIKEDTASASSVPSAATVTLASYSADELSLPGLRHFCFKWRYNVQSTSPMLEEAYEPGSQGHRRLLYLYGRAHELVVHASHARANGEVSDERGTAAMGASGTAASPETSLITSATAARDGPAQPPARPSTPPILPKSVLSRASSTLNETAKQLTAPKPRSSAMHILRTQHESVLAWNTQPFELAIAASPHMSRPALINLARAVAKWVKQEEHKLFIVSAPVF